MAAPTVLTDEDVAVVERLLSLIAQRVYGAIDMGTLCLFFPPTMAGGRRHILDKNETDLRALVVVLRLVLNVSHPVEVVRGTKGARGGEPDAFEPLADGVERMVASLLALEDFRSIPEDELRQRVAAFADAAAGLPAAVRRLGDELEIEVKYLQAMKPETERFYAGVLQNLAENLVAERTSAGAAPPESRGP